MRFNKPEQLAVRVLGHFPLLKAKIKFIYSLVLSLCSGRQRNIFLSQRFQHSRVQNHTFFGYFDVSLEKR